MAHPFERALKIEDIRYLFDYLYEPQTVVIKAPYDDVQDSDDDNELWSGYGTDIPQDYWHLEVIYGDGINCENGTMYVSVLIDDDDPLMFGGYYDESVSRRNRRTARTPKMNLKRR